jgi:hypothetical protein
MKIMESVFLSESYNLSGKLLICWLQYIYMTTKAKVLIIDRHERKRFELGSALDEAGHDVVDFAGSRTAARAVLSLIEAEDIDFVLVGDIECGDGRRQAQAEIVRGALNKGIGRVLGISYNARPLYPGIPNLPILGPEDAQELALDITRLKLQSSGSV